MPGSPKTKGAQPGAISPSELTTLDIGHPQYEAVIDPDNAFWSLVEKGRSGELLGDQEFLGKLRAKKSSFDAEIDRLRYGLVPSAVYFNPTQRCNLNCTYCYLPEEMRRNGKHMSREDLFSALELLLRFFHREMPSDQKPQLIFHGSEPMLNRENVFAAIEKFRDEFIFGIQTNATLLDERAVEFVTGNNISLGLSLDGPVSEIADRTRHTFAGRGVHSRVIRAMERLRGYSNYSVITTVTTENIDHLRPMVELLHRMEVPTCMLNQLRCTQPSSRSLKPDDRIFVERYIEALERSHELYRESGRKLVIANFANILLAIVAPTARRLMCDISPCGAGRCFFAVDAVGDVFPCSEFIGIDHFRGGNLFSEDLAGCFSTGAFKSVTGRKIEDIAECGECPIRHFCGSPCPAEAHQLNGDIETRGAFCEFYKEQVKYAFRLIADGRENDFLWNGWDREVQSVFELTGA